MRELRQGMIDGKIYLFPVPVEKNRKYLIYCSHEVEALKITELVKEGRVTHPDLLSSDFIFLTFHTDKQTKIFVLNPALF